MLKARQEQEENAELLPRVGLEDVPEDRAIPEGTSKRVDGSTGWSSFSTKSTAI